MATFNEINISRFPHIERLHDLLELCRQFKALPECQFLCRRIGFQCPHSYTIYQKDPSISKKYMPNIFIYLKQLFPRVFFPKDLSLSLPSNTLDGLSKRFIMPVMPPCFSACGQNEWKSYREDPRSGSS